MDKMERNERCSNLVFTNVFCDGKALFSEDSEDFDDRSSSVVLLSSSEVFMIPGDPDRELTVGMVTFLPFSLRYNSEKQYKYLINKLKSHPQKDDMPNHSNS